MENCGSLCDLDVFTENCLLLSLLNQHLVKVIFVFFSFNCSDPPEHVSVDLGRMYIYADTHSN